MITRAAVALYVRLSSVSVGSRDEPTSYVIPPNRLDAYGAPRNNFTKPKVISRTGRNPRGFDYCIKPSLDICILRCRLPSFAIKGIIKVSCGFAIIETEAEKSKSEKICTLLNGPSSTDLKELQSLSYNGLPFSVRSTSWKLLAVSYTLKICYCIVVAFCWTHNYI